MTTTARLGVTRLAEGGTSGELIVNSTVDVLDGVLNLVFLDRDLATPPGSPVEGDAYLLPSTGCTGAWAGHEDEVVIYYSGWVFLTRYKGMTGYLDDEKTSILFNGTEWVALPAGGTFFNHMQIGTSPAQMIYTSMVNATPLTTGAPAVDVLRAIPIVVPKSGVVDKVWFHVTAGGGAGSKVRIGIYTTTAEGELTPDDLLWDSGDITTTGTGTIQTNVTPNIRLSPGKLYWLVYLSGVSAPTVRCLALAAMPPILGLDNILSVTPGVGWTVAHAYAALPNPFTGGASRMVAVPIPMVGITLV